MLNDEQLLTFIKEKCNELMVTGYEIGQNTSLPEQTAYRILDGTTAKPRRKNLLKIVEYLENKIVGTNVKPQNASDIVVKNYNLSEEILKVEEEVEAIYRKVSITDIFSDVGTELLVSYKKQISIYEMNTELFKKNTALLEEKINYLSAKN